MQPFSSGLYSASKVREVLHSPVKHFMLIRQSQFSGGVVTWLYGLKDALAIALASKEVFGLPGQHSNAMPDLWHDPKHSTVEYCTVLLSQQLFHVSLRFINNFTWTALQSYVIYTFFQARYDISFFLMFWYISVVMVTTFRVKFRCNTLN